VAWRRCCRADVCLLGASTPRILPWCGWRPAAAPQPCIETPAWRPHEKAGTDGNAEATRRPSSAKLATKMLWLPVIPFVALCTPPKTSKINHNLFFCFTSERVRVVTTVAQEGNIVDHSSIAALGWGIISTHHLGSRRDFLRGGGKQPSCAHGSGRCAVSRDNSSVLQHQEIRTTAENLRERGNIQRRFGWSSWKAALKRGQTPPAPP
jgi:hypothetical protein